MGELLRDANSRYDGERKTRLQLEGKTANISQQYVGLNQQHNILAERYRIGDQAYRELEKAYRHSQAELSHSQQNGRNLRRYLDCERGRIDQSLDTTRMLAQSLQVSLMDKSEVSEEQRQEVREEMEALKAALVKEREKHALPNA